MYRKEEYYYDDDEKSNSSDSDSTDTVPDQLEDVLNNSEITNTEGIICFNWRWNNNRRTIEH